MSLPLLEMRQDLYDELVRDLAKSGRGVKEAGAFLLGDLREPGTRPRQVRSYLMYDVVAPDSNREHDYVAFTAEEMARAWEHCYRTGLQVVADVHTHPLGPGQSETDQAHPIVSLEGHVALIVPYFALRSPLPVDLGVHVFLGAGQWRSMFHEQAREAVLLT